MTTEDVSAEPDPFLDQYGATLRRILAATCAIWHNRTAGQPITRSLIAYDH